jgi:predicted RNA binding protein YcfA (HicA-like mRNA interferase family)
MLGLRLSRAFFALFTGPGRSPKSLSNPARRSIWKPSSKPKLSDVEKHLRKHNVEKLRQGGEHTIYVNPANGKTAAVPRHNELDRFTTKRICDLLDIPRIAGS